VGLRQRIGALAYDWLPFERRIRGSWLEIRNRNETIATDGRGVRCEWRYQSDLHIANVFPSTSARLMRRAFAEWPIERRDAPPPSAQPEVSFLIGHRGLDRLPLLRETLATIAGQRGAAVECIVVEQSIAPEIELPPWVRYIHTPLPRPDLPYCRSWAFNVAARAARGAALILHDNDVLVPARYAAEVLARVREGWQFLDLKRFIFYLSPEQRIATIAQNLHAGVSVVAERAAYEAIGGFDEGFIGWGGEDNDFWDRAESTGRAYAFGYLPMIHLYHSFQPGKWKESAPGVARYRALEAIPPEERIARLRRREQGRVEGPSAD
jgi:N-terminal domain of galactosyltransferase